MSESSPADIQDDLPVESRLQALWHDDTGTEKRSHCLPLTPDGSDSEMSIY